MAGTCCLFLVEYSGMLNVSFARMWAALCRGGWPVAGSLGPTSHTTDRACRGGGRGGFKKYSKKRSVRDVYLYAYRMIMVTHYEKSYTGMNVFRKGMNSFRNGINMFRTGMKTFRIGTGIRGNQNYQKIRNFSGSKNLKEFFQNSKVLKSSYQTKPILKSWNFEKILSYSYFLIFW